MSWYFLGGFSAYAMVPSARVVNHSGWLVDPRVVGRGLQGQVEGDLEAELAGPGDERVEVLEGAEVGMDGVVAAVLAADRPRRAGVVRARGQRVVGALAVDLADRVDRRQVDHVEAHLGDGVQALRGGHEVAGRDLAGLRRAGRPRSAGRTRTSCRRAREVRSAYDRERTLDGDELANRVGREQPLELGVLQGGQPGLGRPVGVAARPRCRPAVRRPRGRRPARDRRGPARAAADPR